MATKKLLSFSIKLIISIIFFVVLFVKVDWRETWGLLVTGNIGLYVVVFLLGLMALLVGAYRWQLILKAQNAVLSVWFLFKLKLIGLFFNNFLPSGAGNDLVRVFYLQQSRERQLQLSPSKSLASVALERLSGILSAVILLITAVILNLNLLIELSILVQLLGLILILLVISFCVLNRWLVDSLAKLKIRNKWFNKMVSFLDNFYQEIDFYKKNIKVLVLTILIALVLQILSVIIFYSATLAVGADISIISLLFICPIVLTVSLLPITINGLGLTEAMIFFLYTSIGLTSVQALSSALVVRLINILISLIGLGLYLKHSQRVQQVQ